MAKSIGQSLSTICTSIESIRGMLNGLEEELDNINMSLGRAPYFSDEDSEEEEEDEDEPRTTAKKPVGSGWVIVDPNPPNMKGLDHYFCGDPDEDWTDKNEQWTGTIEEATVFDSVADADVHKQAIKEDKQQYWGKKSKCLGLVPAVPKTELRYVVTGIISGKPPKGKKGKPITTRVYLRPSPVKAHAVNPQEWRKWWTEDLQMAEFYGCFDQATEKAEAWLENEDYGYEVCNIRVIRLDSNYQEI